MVFVHDTNSWDYFLSVDDRNYHEMSSDLSSSWEQGQFNLESRTYYYNKGYLIINTAVYYILGSNTFNMRLINIFFGSLIAVIMFLFTSRAWNYSVGKIVGYLVAFFPSLIIISIFQFKDVFILFFLSLFFLYLQKFSESKNFQSFILILYPIIAIFFFRKPMALILFAIIACLIFFDKSRGTYPLKYKYISISGLIIIVAIVYIRGLWGYDLASILGYPEFTLSRLSNDSILLKLININKSLGYLGSAYLTVFGGIYFSFDSPLSIWLFPNNILTTFFAIPLFFVGLISSNKNIWNKILLICMSTVLFFCVFGLQGGNFRYWLPGLILMFVFIASGKIYYKNKRYFTLFILSLLVSFTLSFSYLIIKRVFL